MNVAVFSRELVGATVHWTTRRMRGNGDSIIREEKGTEDLVASEEELQHRWAAAPDKFADFGF